MIFNSADFIFIVRHVFMIQNLVFKIQSLYVLNMCDLWPWVVRKQHRVENFFFFRGFILTAVSQKDSDRWEKVGY